jgi:hypothetical protein
MVLNLSVLGTTRRQQGSSQVSKEHTHYLCSFCAEASFISNRLSQKQSASNDHQTATDGRNNAVHTVGTLKYEVTAWLVFQVHKGKYC